MLVSKYIGKMTDSEIMVIFVSGMGSMEVSILAGYAAGGIPMQYLLIASVLVSVGSILVAKMLLPETEEALSIDNVKMDNKGQNTNVIDAIVGGASTGMSMIIWCAIITFVMCIIAKIEWFDFCPGTFMGCFTTFAANGDWKLLSVSLVIGALLGLGCDYGGVWLHKVLMGEKRN